MYRQGRAKGAATLSRAEGCRYGEGGVYFDCTNGGDEEIGQVWEYRPGRHSGGSTEGILPAPEVAHDTTATIDLVLEAKEVVGEEEKIMPFNLCGLGRFDLAAYKAYLAGNLVDLEYSEEDTDRAVARIPG